MQIVLQRSLDSSVEYGYKATWNDVLVHEKGVLYAKWSRV